MVGIDEVGRGCWAGPLVVVAVRLKQDIPGLNDSKKLSKKQREMFFPLIAQNSDIGLAVIKPPEIDHNGLGASLYKAFRQAYQAIAQQGETIIIDGNVNYLKAITTNAICKINADSNYPEVSAASIYAKVYRDNYMHKVAKKYPNYGFERNVGYGTKQHISALNKYGPVNGLHRYSFAPIKELLT